MVCVHLYQKFNSAAKVLLRLYILNLDFQVVYQNGKKHTFKIFTYYPCQQLSNREVTFVLGFTWKSPTAFDVRDIGKISFQAR